MLQMKRSILSLVVIISVLACASKNEYGKKRFNLLAPYDDIYVICDSINVFKGFYKLKIKENQTTPGRKNFIVFYGYEKLAIS